MPMRSDADLDAEVRALTLRSEDDVDTNDIPEVLEWDNAERAKFYRPVKQAVTMRLDRDVLAWFKACGAGYQTRINQALREYIRTHKNP